MRRSRPTRPVLFLLLLLLAATAPAAGQHRAPARFTLAPAACCRTEGADHVPVSDPRMVGGGLLGGLGGLLLGAAIGARFDQHSNCTGEICDMTGAFVGAGIGELVGIPLGVHLANHRHGNLLLDAAASTGALVAGALLLSATRDETIMGVGTLAIPFVQAGAATWAERRWTR